MVAASLTGKAVGQSVKRVDGVAKVTGRARYAGDFDLPGMIFGRALRNPHPSARIVSIDVRRAKALPGVHAVLTGADVPDALYGRMCKDIPILAKGVARFVGEKVAAVAADTAEIAEAALELIDIVYEALPAVFSAEDAMRPTAPIIHPEAVEVFPGAAAGIHGELSMYPAIPNVISRLTVGHGDAARALASAHKIFEHRFAVPSVHQGYIEPHTCLVAIAADGLVDVWMANKGPHIARAHMAAAIGVPEDRIRFNPVVIGGDFGGKGSLMDLLLCYCLARAAGRPVKMAMNSFEELTAGNPRHSAGIRLRTGVDRDAKLLGIEARVIFNAGAYAGFVPVPTLHGGYSELAGTYRVPNCAIEVLRVYTNTVPCGHMRSPGAPQVAFAVESHIDMIARELGLDPVEMRRRNAIADGDLTPLGETRRHLRCREVIDAGARAFGWEKPRPAGTGRGISIYEHPPGNFGPSTVTLTMNADGRITTTVGAPDTGTGFHTIAAQLVAEHFGFSVDQVDVVQGDTLSTGFEFGSSGQRLTTTIGQAIAAAAEAMKESLAALAAERLNCAPSDIEMREGSFSAPGATIDLPALMGWAAARGKAPLSCQGRNKPGPTDRTGFVAHFAEVTVDRETGQVRLQRVVTAHDVGTIVNPIMHQGQIEGGLIQAVGQAMSERIVLKDGAVITAHLGDYKLPTIADIPELETVLLPGGGGAAPFSTTAIGEMSNVAVSAAITNAVFDAVGARLIELPITAEKVLQGLSEKASAP